MIKNEKFLFYNYIPTLAKHVLDFPLDRSHRGIIPKHNYPEFIINNIQEGDIIFVKTDLLKMFFNKIFMEYE